MSPLIIPYRFTAGTYAKAEEVNDNFAQTKQFCDTLETSLAEHDVSIMQLENNKADINGNNGEIFRVANAINDFDAVNKQTFMDGIWNTLEVIRGLEITKASNNQVTIAEGGCYDSTLSYLMRSYDSMTTEAFTMTTNTIYYIFLVGNDTGDVSAVFSTNSGSPSLPAGYTLYRNIGYVQTDSNGNIDTINTDRDITGNNTGNGYIRFKNGLTLQWGRQYGWTHYTQSQTFNFPKAFTNIYQAFISYNVVQGVGDNGDSMGLTGITNSGLTVYCGIEQSNAPNDSYSSLYVNWFAIGYTNS